MPPTPTRAINLRPRRHLARARRPLHLELVADDVLDIEITFDCPHANQFAAGLAELTEVDPGSRGRFLAELLGEFPVRRLLRILARLVLALGDRPGTVVLLGPERAAGMHHEHFENPTAIEAIRQQPCTLSRHHQPPGPRRDHSESWNARRGPKAIVEYDQPG